MPTYTDLDPIEAVTAARCDAAEGRGEAWDALDGFLRTHVLTYLQERRGEITALREALLEAIDWARLEKRSPWQHRWPNLLELLRDGERLPSTAGSLGAVRGPEGRAAELLALLVDHEEPMRPEEVARRLGLSPQHVSNLSRKLEEASLIVRQKARGRATWMFATPRGVEVAACLPRPKRTKSVRGNAEPYLFWGRAGEPVPAIH